MSKPRWGRVYALAVPGAQAEMAVVVSENDWNDSTRDAVIIPVYRESAAPGANVHVNLNDDLMADCTRVQNLAQEFLGDDEGPCPAQALTRIRLGLRVYLDIDRLIAKSSRSAPPGARSEWWPHQGDVHYATERNTLQSKMFAAISDDDWNSRPTTSYSAFVRLTSVRDDWRERWEVEVPGGCSVAGHLYSLGHADVQQELPPADKPQRLSSDEMSELAQRLEDLLRLR